jgi:DNA-binding NarL/FixJ family response regulator
MKTFEVVLADDHKLFVEGMKALITGINGSYKLKLVGVANDGSSLLEMLKSITCDLVLLDLNMPGESGLELIPLIKELLPNTYIIVISGYGDSKVVRKAFKKGVDGYLHKTSGLKELHTAVTEVMAGKTFWGEGLSLSPPRNRREGQKASEGDAFEDQFTIKQNLTRRESEILQLISQAQSNKEIAKELYISPETVSVHRKNIMRKLGVNNAASLIKFALDHNLV